MERWQAGPPLDAPRPPRRRTRSSRPVCEWVCVWLFVKIRLVVFCFSFVFIFLLFFIIAFVFLFLDTCVWSQRVARTAVRIAVRSATAYIFPAKAVNTAQISPNTKPCARRRTTNALLLAHHSCTHTTAVRRRLLSHRQRHRRGGSAVGLGALWRANRLHPGMPRPLCRVEASRAAVDVATAGGSGGVE